jgi:hypothetical protein
LRVQLPARTSVAPLLDRLVSEAIPNQPGLAAWRALIHAHATLMRQLATDLVDNIGLTDAGVARLAEAAPVHLRRVRELFVERLSDAELAILASALEKVAVDCGFG